METVHFLNLFERKAHLIEPEGVANGGWDDENGEYLWRAFDHIDFRYEIKKILGKGSFGVVLQCFDHKRKELIALKIVRNKDKLKKQGMVEVGLLKYMNENDEDDRKNIVQMYEYFNYRNHLCIVFEKLSINLYDFIRENNFRGISENLTR